MGFDKGLARKVAANDAAQVVSDDLGQLAANIKAAHGEAVGSASTALMHAMKCGDLLIAAKAQCKTAKEKWLPWLAKNFPGHRKTAAEWMRFASRRSDLEANVTDGSHLTFDEARKLLRKPRQSKEEAPDSYEGDWWVCECGVSNRPSLKKCHACKKKKTKNATEIVDNYDDDEDSGVIDAGGIATSLSRSITKLVGDLPDEEPLDPLIGVLEQWLGRLKKMQQRRTA